MQGDPALIEIYGIDLTPVGLNLYICYCRLIQKKILDQLPSMMDQILNKRSQLTKLCKKGPKFEFFTKDHKDHTDYQARI